MSNNYPHAKQYTLKGYIKQRVKDGSYSSKREAYEHLASIVKVKASTIKTWTSTTIVKSEYVLALEYATDGNVSRHTLRPDIYPKKEK